MLTLFSGLAAGAAHVVTGPDHLAALAPIAVDEPKRAARLGFRWGVGHGLGVIFLGGLGVFLRRSVDISAISAWAEFFVGAVLIFVGLWAFRRAANIVVHAHEHDHVHQGDAQHTHLHVHATNDDHDAPGAHRGHSHAAFFVGVLHGLAGTGHIFGVLPSLALPPAEAVLYLSAYFVAAVLSMTGFGALMGTLIRHQGPRRLRQVMYCASSSAVLLGVIWMGKSWPL